MPAPAVLGRFRPPPVPGPMFCTPFDEALAAGPTPAIFLHDGEGLLRFDAEWTRDAWQRVDPADRTVGPTTSEWCWLLVTDRKTGWSMVVLATSPELLRHHPRVDAVRHATREDAFAALFALGVPPVRR